MGHKMHNKKYKPPMDKIPQYEVLQLYRKARKPLERYFIANATEFDYTSDIGLICASKYRSISDPCTIQAPLKNPLGVFSKTPSTNVDMRSKTTDLLKITDMESVAELI